jgi:hypothetical protein
MRRELSKGKAPVPEAIDFLRLHYRLIMRRPLSHRPQV